MQGYGLRLTKVDSVIFIRALAIFMIVSGHVRSFGFYGGADVLLMLAGFTYAKYVVPSLHQNSVANSRQIFLLLKIGIPALLFLFLQQTVSPAAYNWPAILLFSNYIEPTLHALWFIEVYFQINILLLIVAQFGAGARALRGLESFFPSAVLFVLSFVLLAGSVLFWDSAHLFNRVVPRVFWLFAAGIVLAASDTLLRRAFFVAVTLVAGFVSHGASISVLFVFSVFFLAVVREIHVPALLVPLLKSVAGASLMIYLTHFQWANAFEGFFPALPRISYVIAGLAGGVLLQRLYDPIWRVIKGFLSKSNDSMSGRKKSAGG